MTDLLSLLKRFAIHLSVALAGFAIATGFILVQDQREVLAQHGYQQARQQALAEVVRAQSVGLTLSEVSDMLRQDQTVVAGSAPSGTAPFNEARIDFYYRARSEELQVAAVLQGREAGLLTQTRTAAQDDLVKLIGELSAAQQLGVDQPALQPLAEVTVSVGRGLNQASTVSDYRGLSAQLKPPMQKLALLMADQQNTNVIAGKFAAQAAAIDQGDAVAAIQTANGALSQVRGDLQFAQLFQVDVAVIQSHVDQLAARLGTGMTAPAIDQITGGLQARDQELQQAMNQSLPEKAITISLGEQVLRAYEKGHQVFSTYITTGRPGLETDRGNFKVYSKQSPFVMHSPWPKGSPYWYPDTPVKTVMWFNGGAGIHDASWRAYFGPGTEFPHYDPYGDNNGSHGCVNIPPRNMPWLWDWTPVGTPVIVY